MHDLEHPGAVMREWWLEGADAATAAARLGVAPVELQRVLDGRSDISRDLAAQLEAGGWSTAAFWIRLQAACDRDRHEEQAAPAAARHPRGPAVSESSASADFASCRSGDLRTTLRGHQ